jgi:hypothetical protein
MNSNDLFLVNNTLFEYLLLPLMNYNSLFEYLLLPLLNSYDL